MAFRSSLIFLALRLLWMASIVFVTTDTVLVPLLQIDPGWSPWICIGLAVLTICYTSLGGIRAVVWTDVVQTAILFAGALAAVAIVTAHFGGISGWFPRTWQDHWPPPVWGLDTKVRLSFVGLLVAHFCWHVCTAGSDQMKGFSTAEDVAEAVVMAAVPRPRSRIVNIIMRPMNEAT